MTTAPPPRSPCTAPDHTSPGPPYTQGGPGPYPGGKTGTRLAIEVPLAEDLGDLLGGDTVELQVTSRSASTAGAAALGAAQPAHGTCSTRGTAAAPAMGGAPNPHHPQ